MKLQYLVSTLVCLGAASGSACAQEQDGGRLQPLGEGVSAAVMSVTPDDYLRKLGVIAHDSMGGRDTPSPGLEMTAASEAVLQEIRGREVAMIFQNPRTALNPIRPVGRQIEDVLLRHVAATRRTVQQQALEALVRVHIPDPAQRYRAYPYELSGGLCQRVLIAMQRF